MLICLDLFFCYSGNSCHKNIEAQPVLGLYHRLNGCSSSVLMETSLFYGKAKNLTPHRIKTPDRIQIKIWHGWLRWRRDPSRVKKFEINI